LEPQQKIARVLLAIGIVVALAWVTLAVVGAVFGIGRICFPQSLCYTGSSVSGRILTGLFAIEGALFFTVWVTSVRAGVKGTREDVKRTLFAPPNRRRLLMLAAVVVVQLFLAYFLFPDSAIRL
jgi:hypothetical protein